MRRPVVIGIAAAIAGITGAYQSPAVQGTQGPESSSTRPFNGTDVTGWKFGGPPESFTIRHGAMVANREVSHAYYDGSFQNDSFRNFERPAARVGRSRSQTARSLPIEEPARQSLRGAAPELARSLEHALAPLLVADQANASD